MAKSRLEKEQEKNKGRRAASNKSGKHSGSNKNHSSNRSNNHAKKESASSATIRLETINDLDLSKVKESDKVMKVYEHDDDELLTLDEERKRKLSKLAEENDDEEEEKERDFDKKMKKLKAKKEKINKKYNTDGERVKYTGGEIFKMLLSFCFKLGVLGIIVVLCLLYSPWPNFREWLITTAMTTMHHQYFATWFYDPDVIVTVLDKNQTEQRDDVTDKSLIDANANTFTTQYKDEYDRQVLERDPKNNDYKIIPIKGDNYSGYLVAVYEPQRMKAAVTSQMGVSGEYVTKMATDHDALIAINGGGFVDTAGYNGMGETPMGISVVDGELIGPNQSQSFAGLIGFDNENNLICGQMTKSQVEEAGIRDGLTFGPFLLINGEASNIKGDGGWGNAPRTVIGQRADGIVLLMVVDGRKAGELGATIRDELEVMERYGAVNAANLDGGTSSVLVVGDTIVNDPIDSAFAHKTRPIASCFYLEKDDSDDSDHQIVQKKLNK